MLSNLAQQLRLLNRLPRPVGRPLQAVPEVRAEVTEERAYAPHCDQRVLHAPGECRHCDHYPDWQQARTVQGINFTGHYEDGKSLCPSQMSRSIDKIEAWYGNRRD